MLRETRKALDALLSAAHSQIPPEVRESLSHVQFKPPQSGIPYFPCGLKESEAISALKAVEAATVAAVANVRWEPQEREAVVDMDRAACFLFSAYLATVRGLHKSDPSVKSCLKGRFPSSLVDMDEMDAMYDIVSVGGGDRLLSRGPLPLPFAMHTLTRCQTRTCCKLNPSCTDGCRPISTLPRTQMSIITCTGRSRRLPP
jgi:hypothetical protein